MRGQRKLAPSLGLDKIVVVELQAMAAETCQRLWSRQRWSAEKNHVCDLEHCQVQPNTLVSVERRDLV